MIENGRYEALGDSVKLAAEADKCSRITIIPSKQVAIITARQFNRKNKKKELKNS